MRRDKPVGLLEQRLNRVEMAVIKLKQPRL